MIMSPKTILILTNAVVFSVACGQSTEPNRSTSAVIDQEGGTVQSADGRVELVIAANAVERPTDIDIAAIAQSTRVGAIGRTYEIRPSTLILQRPSQLILSYQGSNPIALVRFDGSRPRIVSASIDTEKRTISAMISNGGAYSAWNTAAACNSAETCLDGYTCGNDDTCAPTSDDCTSNTDCPAGKICIDAVCRAPTPPGTCQSDSDCSAGQVCRDSVCQSPLPPGSCQRNEDCDTDQVCNDGECIETPANGCRTDGDCGEDEVCSNQNVCIPNASSGVTRCDADADCPQAQQCDAVAHRCILRSALPSCSTDTDCPQGLQCNLNCCVTRPSLPPYPRCQSDADCKEIETCETITLPDGEPLSRCRLRPRRCRFDEDCGLTSICSDGVCENNVPSACTDDADCRVFLTCDASRQVCEPSSCTSDGDCAPGLFCTDFTCQVLEGAFCRY